MTEAAEFNWSHIELAFGTVTEAYIEGADGKRALLTEMGQQRFFIDAVEADGGRLGLDTCDDYETATRLAEEARVGFGIDAPVHDNVVGSH